MQLEDVKRFYGTAGTAGAHPLRRDAVLRGLRRAVHEDRIRHRARATSCSCRGGNRIWADRMEFNTKTRTGVVLQRARHRPARRSRSDDRSMFGTQEPDAEFWGERDRKARAQEIPDHRGGFTTCVQPTPRWELVSGTVTLNLDDYALLTNALFRVKGVPLMYLPAFYYPIQEDDRATGLPDPDLRLVDAQGADHQQRLLLGDRPQPRRHVLSRLDVEGRPAARRRVPLRARARARRATAGSPGSTRNGDSTAATAWHRPRAARELFDRRRFHADAARHLLRCAGQRRLLLQHRHPAAVSAGPVPRHQPDPRGFGTFTTGTLGGSIRSAPTSTATTTSIPPTALTTLRRMPRVNISRPERPIGGSPVYFGVGGEYVTLLRSSRRTT